MVNCSRVLCKPCDAWEIKSKLDAYHFERILLLMSFVIRCLDCGHAADFNPSSMHCPKCNSQWREAEYDLEEVSKSFPAELISRPFDLWRYRELLPIDRKSVV